MNGISEKVKTIVGSGLGVEASQLADEAHLQDDLNADQLSLADIVVSLEEEFKIEIPQEDVEKFITIGDIVTYVAEHLNEL